MYFQQTCTVLNCAVGCVVQHKLNNKAGPRAVSGQSMYVSFVLFCKAIVPKADVEIMSGIATVARHSSWPSKYAAFKVTK